MAKLIYTRPDGIQVCEEVGPGGKCNDSSKQIWNENTDGPLPDGLLENIGALFRLEDGTVIVNEKVRRDSEAANLRVAATKILTKRAQEYPTVEAQLEALYDARNGDTRKLEEVDRLIAVVKTKYPKPIEVTEDTWWTTTLKYFGLKSDG